jgi:hypothetical protein
MRLPAGKLELQALDSTAMQECLGGYLSMLAHIEHEPAILNVICYFHIYLFLPPCTCFNMFNMAEIWTFAVGGT